MQVMVCGAGAIGASIAYYLASAGADVTVVERAGVACAASGKSGGFLALDWCDGQPVERLARRSFALHEQLAGSLGADWCYRRMTTYAGYEATGDQTGPVDWVGRVAITQKLGGPRTTAQVHPARYTGALMDAAVARGARLLAGAVEGVETGPDSAVTGLVVDGAVHPAEAVVVAMGPWSILAARWLPLPAVYGMKGHSLVYRTGDRLPAEALFLECKDAAGTATPEVFPRSDGTTYVCAISSQTPLPVDPAAVGPDEGAFARLEAMCARLSPVLADSPVVARGACFRPVTADGWPVIGPVPGVPGAFVATGHSVWGILNAPATGEAMAELIETGSTRHVDIAAFAPARLPRLDPALLAVS
ncbi:FAD-binding oxidoreductase [Acuticoccus sediminis]|uniref:FAD-binding oxidoreductase n=1 Tax=Acuticoccus sediminis TaxID=2184697 RepID=A0A8B2NSP9_9HYPH|nr:FAD-dependent oxidoreductase [Acuticoccus sediminis]RAI03247.1 FAD-binding oxidoreductase [Acuticoccus sediminis]